MKIFLAETGHIQSPDESFDYSRISEVGELEMANLLDVSHVPDKNLDAQILIVGRLVWSREALSKFPNLRLIVKMGTGVEKIDLAAARERGIAVANLSGYAAEPVGQATMAYILSFASSLPQYDHDVREGKWKEVQFSHPMMILKGKTLGIIGLGGISRKVIQLAKGIGMRINVYTRYPDAALDVEYIALETIATDSDFISIHCALDDHTRGLVGAEFLSKVKKSAYLINTARPAVVEEKAITDALREGRIAGLAIDGFWREPPTANHELFEMRNVIITPHITWAPVETRQWMLNEVGSVIHDFITGSPRNIVN